MLLMLAFYVRRSKVHRMTRRNRRSVAVLDDRHEEQVNRARQLRRDDPLAPALWAVLNEALRLGLDILETNARTRLLDQETRRIRSQKPYERNSHERKS